MYWPLYDTCLGWGGFLPPQKEKGVPRLSGVSFPKESEEAAAKSYSMTTFLIVLPMPGLEPGTELL